MKNILAFFLASASPWQFIDRMLTLVSDILWERHINSRFQTIKVTDKVLNLTLKVSFHGFRDIQKGEKKRVINKVIEDFTSLSYCIFRLCLARDEDSRVPFSSILFKVVQTACYWFYQVSPSVILHSLSLLFLCCISKGLASNTSYLSLILCETLCTSELKVLISSLVASFCRLRCICCNASASDVCDILSILSGDSTKLQLSSNESHWLWVINLLFAGLFSLSDWKEGGWISFRFWAVYLEK